MPKKHLDLGIKPFEKTNLKKSIKEHENEFCLGVFELNGFTAFLYAYLECWSLYSRKYRRSNMKTAQKCLKNQICRFFRKV